MSDQPSGPGWWLASDGKWYPPDQAPPVPPPELWAPGPPSAPPRTGLSTGAFLGLVIGGVVGVFVLVGLAIALLGSDDGDAASAVAPAVVPEGFALVEGDGVSMAVPAGWRQIDPDELDTDVLDDAFPDASTELDEPGATPSEQGVVLVAMDGDDPPYTANVNIVSVPMQVSLAELTGVAEAQLRPLGAQINAIERAHLPVGDAVRVAYTVPVALPDGTSATAAGVQHHIPLDGRTYTITTSSMGDPGELADEMAATFRVD
jgi:hypothetical protein